MAKYEKRLQGNFDNFCTYLKQAVIGGSISASLEEECYRRVDQVSIGILTFERYSAMGSNRVSLNVTIIGWDEWLEVIAITSGGSQAVLFKVNTWGEERFLECLRKYVESYRER